MKKPVRPCGHHPLRWSTWTTPTKFTEKPVGPGQYQVRLAKNGKAVAIQRAKQTDHDGLLYWGETKNLSDRFLKLVASFANPTLPPKHSAACNYFTNPSMQQKYPLGSVQVRYKHDSLPVTHPKAPVIWPDKQGKARSEIGERSGLHSYKARFGEWPPLNARAGKNVGKRFLGSSADPTELKPSPMDKHIELSDGYGKVKKIKKQGK